MLEAISRTNPHTTDDVLAAVQTGRNLVARDHESGAKLYQSRDEYILILEEPPTTQSWSRREFRKNQDAIERANEVLAEILKG